MTLGQWITIVVFATALPLIALAWFLMEQLARNERQTISQSLMATAQTLGSLVSTEIDTYLALCNSIRVLRTIELDDPEVFRRQAEGMLANVPGSWITIFDPQGKPLRSTLVDVRQPQPPRGARDVMMRAWQTGKPQLSNVVFGRITKRYNAFVECPVFRDNQPWYSIVIGVNPDRFHDLIHDRFGDDAVIGILDARLNYVARQPAHEQHVGKPASPAWKKAIEAAQAGVAELTTLEGIPVLGAYTRTRDGWTVGVARPLNALDAAARHGRWAMALLSGALLGMSLLVGLGLANALSRVMGRLVAAADALGMGKKVEAGGGLVTEAAAIGRAMRIAADELAQRETVLGGVAVAARVGLWLVDDSYTIRFANRAWLEMIGLDPSADVVGRPLEEVIGPDRFEWVKAAEPRLRQGESVTSERSGTVPGADRTPAETRLVTLQPALVAGGSLEGVLGVVVDISERKRSEEHLRLLMHEVNHRSKNILSVVQAVAHQTATHSPHDFVERFGERIAAMGASHDLLVKSGWRNVWLAELLRSQLGHFEDLIDTRIRLEGADVAITAAAAQCIGMAIHELSTNAAKYGALSSEAGMVRVSWWVEAQGEASKPALTLEWREMDGPPVRPPARRGFGYDVLKPMVELTLDADVTLDYAEDGVVWRMRCSLSKLTEADGGRG
ncbi:MAG: sensor histidine kinase [Hyphomicrobiaceae bacterium]